MNKPEDLDKIDHPEPPFPYRWVEMFPEQVSILSMKWNSSILVNGGPGTGKTVLAVMSATRLMRERKRCLFIAPTILSLKNVKHAYAALGLNRQTCISFYEFERHPMQVDVILLDDSHRYSLEQIKTLASSSQYLSLFGDYSHNSLAETEKTKINEIVQAIHCQVFNIHRPSSIPSSFLRLIPMYAESMCHSSRRSELPYIVKCNSIEEQCRTIMKIVEEMSLEDIGILCYTRKLVQKSQSIFASLGLPVEVYLPGKLDGMDTIDFNSANPKIMTISSSAGIHFKTVFVIGFDKKMIWKNQEETIITIATRPSENLYIFYEDQMPDQLALVPRDFYRDSIIPGNFTQEAYEF